MFYSLFNLVSLHICLFNVLNQGLIAESVVMNFDYILKLINILTAAKLSCGYILHLFVSLAPLISDLFGDIQCVSSLGC